MHARYHNFELKIRFSKKYDILPWKKLFWCPISPGRKKHFHQYIWCEPISSKYIFVSEPFSYIIHLWRKYTLENTSNIWLSKVRHTIKIAWWQMDPGLLSLWCVNISLGKIMNKNLASVRHHFLHRMQVHLHTDTSHTNASYTNASHTNALHTEASHSDASHFSTLQLCTGTSNTEGLCNLAVHHKARNQTCV